MAAFYDLDGHNVTSSSSYEVTGSYAMTFPTVQAGSYVYQDLTGGNQTATGLAIGSDSSSSTSWAYTSYETFTAQTDTETSPHPITHVGNFTNIPANFQGHLLELSTDSSWEQGFVIFTNSYDSDPNWNSYVTRYDVATIWDTDVGLANSYSTTVVTVYPPAETIYLTSSVELMGGFVGGDIFTEYPYSETGDWRNEDRYHMTPVQAPQMETLTLTTGFSTNSSGSSYTELYGLYKRHGNQSTGYKYTGGANQLFTFDQVTLPIYPPNLVPDSMAKFVFENGVATTATTITQGFVLDGSNYKGFSFGISDSTNNWVEIANVTPQLQLIVPNNYFGVPYEYGFQSGFSYDVGSYDALEKSMALYWQTTTSGSDTTKSVVSSTTFENQYAGEAVTYSTSNWATAIAINGTIPATLAGMWGFTSYYSTGTSTASTHFSTTYGNSFYTVSTHAMTIGEPGIDVVASPKGLIAEVYGYSGYF